MKSGEKMENLYRCELTNECEVYDYNDDGYKALVYYNGWRVAIINYAEHFDETNFEKIERHLETDEVFILIDGQATLVVGTDCKQIPMEKGKIYNIKKNGWHGIFVNKLYPETKVIVVENADTSKENTEYLYIK
mgnify:CR=1 FL=1